MLANFNIGVIATIHKLYIELQNHAIRQQSLFCNFTLLKFNAQLIFELNKP